MGKGAWGEECQRTNTSIHMQMDKDSDTKKNYVAMTKGQCPLAWDMAMGPPPKNLFITEYYRYTLKILAA